MIWPLPFSLIPAFRALGCVALRGTRYLSQRILISFASALNSSSPVSSSALQIFASARSARQVRDPDLLLEDISVAPRDVGMG